MFHSLARWFEECLTHLLEGGPYTYSCPAHAHLAGEIFSCRRLGSMGVTEPWPNKGPGYPGPVSGYLLLWTVV